MVLVIGAVSDRPCLTALVLMGVSYFVDGDRSVSHRRRQFVAENRCIYPFKPVGPYPLTPPVADSNEDRAGGRSRTRSPPQIGFPKDSLIQWLRSAPLQASDWAKKGVRGVPGGVLVTFSPRKK